jgi:hypothetical protein
LKKANPINPLCWVCGKRVSDDDVRNSQYLRSTLGMVCTSCNTRAAKMDFEGAPPKLELLYIFRNIHIDGHKFVDEVVDVVMRWKKEKENIYNARPMKPGEENILPRNRQTAFTSKDAKTDVEAPFGWHGQFWEETAWGRKKRH